MLDGLTPDQASRLVLAIGGVGAALVLLVLVLIFLKRRNSPLFIKGGKAREPRLLILDAAAVDPKRRLVLIRRDNVEHLIMIGGPTDIVIETGINDKSKAAPAVRQPETALEDLAPVSRAIAPPQAEPRILPAATERRIEPTPVAEPAPRPIERPTPATYEARPVAPAQRPASAQPIVANVAPTPSIQPETKSVSAMGSMLYDEDREPLTGNNPVQLQPQAPQRQTPMAAPRVDNPQSAFSQPQREEPIARPTAAAAENILDQARSRVLSSQPATITPQAPSTSPDQSGVEAERALAARLEAARVDAMRRAQSAQASGQTAQPAPMQRANPPIAQQVQAPPVTSLPVERLRDAAPSDFEKLLEAELDASGIFGDATSPPVRSDNRAGQPAPFTAGQNVRSSAPITGATPDLTSEEEVARLLGEIAINRKS